DLAVELEGELVNVQAFMVKLTHPRPPCGGAAKRGPSPSRGPALRGPTTRRSRKSRTTSTSTSTSTTTTTTTTPTTTTPPDRPAARVVELGRSLEGRPILALVIGRSEARVLYVGVHHAREWLSADLVLRLADHLLRAPDARTRRLVAEREAWLVPVLNPDG